ncbi:MAG: hydroxyacid dehydrogenase [Steroidobacteraceae bacterium]
MAEIVICEFMDESIVRQAFAGRDALYDPKLVDAPGDLATALGNARALIVRNRTRVDSALLAQAPRLRVVGRLGVGLDNIDLEACKARAIQVIPATGANDIAVAEYVITAMLVLLRRAWFASAAVAAGEWPRMALIGRETSGKRLGLVGLGAIARDTAQRARALGMSVAACDPHLPDSHPGWQLAERLDLDTLFASSDAVSLHVPLTPATRGLADARRLALMKRGAILINSARGGVVDESALVHALRAGQLGGAALDVFEREPLDADAGRRFAGLPNLLLTPHIAGVTEESNVRVSAVTAAAVLRTLDA